MLYRIKFVSEEASGFSRIIDIDPDNSFLQLKDAILESVNFTSDDNQSFFLCDDNWKRDTEISSTDNTYSDQDPHLMDETPISEILQDEGDKLSFLFDKENNREFFMELKEIIFGEKIDTPKCIKAVGNPPIQHIITEELIQPKIQNRQHISDDIDIEFYGDDQYNEDELEGFDINEEEE
ncbi:MAG: hypothetical protein NC201_01055 [Prevotella sp.]|nr:hypothetical protein [Bacteroides sp.]MCM1365815.1 hypothetical protein [Prevotella sp.]MCM1436493.1 hypothetical protein [Prevotella sp.]